MAHHSRMEISVQTDIDRALRQLTSITEAQQLRFAVAAALTDTALDGQAEVRRNMRRRFIIRRDWIIKGIRIKPATKAKLEAWVYSIDEFMGRQERGEAKRPARDTHLAVPYQARTSPQAIIRNADLPQHLGKKEIEIVNRKGVKRTIKGKGGEAFKFEAGGVTYLVRRRGAKLEFLYALQRQTKPLKPRLGLADDVRMIARTRFGRHLQRRMEMALRTAR